MGPRLVGCAALLLVAACFPSKLDPLDAGTTTGGDLADGSFLPFQPCNSVADYDTSATTISFGGALGTTFAPRCLTVHAGTTVTFSGSFDNHPLHASTRATGPSPIQDTPTGTSAAFLAPTPGYYPFYCGNHGTDAGSGMSGVLRVIP